MFSSRVREISEKPNLHKYIAIELLYTIFIVGVSIAITYFILIPKVDQKISSIPVVKFLSQSKPTTTEEDNYTERGSPYDNRTVNGNTDNSNVIFHGPRDKKRIAITFDAEMTDGMRANYVSGNVKSSYDKH